MSNYDQVQEVSCNRYDIIEEVQKFNPYHDSRGRFSTAGAATSFTYKPGQGKMYDNAIAREKLRVAGAGGGQPKSNLVSGLGEEHAKAIEAIVQQSAPQEFQQMWNKHAGDINVLDNNYSGLGKNRGAEGIFVDVARDADGIKARDGQMSKGPYQVTLHESGHALDHIISGKVGYRFSEQHNNGAFEKTLVKEANDYIKGHQKSLQERWGRKVGIAEARNDLAWNMFMENDRMATGVVSDILGGATKGKFVGTAGHSAAYWKGVKLGDNWVNAHSVAAEAFAQFSCLPANSKAAARMKSVFPESYKEYLSMCAYAATV